MTASHKRKEWQPSIRGKKTGFLKSKESQPFIRGKNNRVSKVEGMTGFHKNKEWQDFIRGRNDWLSKEHGMTGFHKRKEWQAFQRWRNNRLSKDNSMTGFPKRKEYKFKFYWRVIISDLSYWWSQNYNLRKCDKKQLKLNERKDYWKTLMRGDNGSFYNKLRMKLDFLGKWLLKSISNLPTAL